MQPSSNGSGGAGVAAATFVGFFAVTIFAAAIGSYIGRHSTPGPVEAVAEPVATSPPAAVSPSPAPAAPASQPPAAVAPKSP
jgi:hypothetical protein